MGNRSTTLNTNSRPRILCCRDLGCWDPNQWKSRWHLLHQDFNKDQFDEPSAFQPFWETSQTFPAFHQVLVDVFTLSFLVDNLQQSCPGVFDNHLEDLFSQAPIHVWMLRFKLIIFGSMSHLLVEDAVSSVVQRLDRLQLHIIPILASTRRIGEWYRSPNPSDFSFTRWEAMKNSTQQRQAAKQVESCQFHQVSEEPVHPFHINLVVRPPVSQSKQCTMRHHHEQTLRSNDTTATPHQQGCFF